MFLSLHGRKILFPCERIFLSLSSLSYFSSLSLCLSPSYIESIPLSRAHAMEKFFLHHCTPSLLPSLTISFHHSPSLPYHVKSLPPFHLLFLLSLSTATSSLCPSFPLLSFTCIPLSILISLLSHILFLSNSFSFTSSLSLSPYRSLFTLSFHIVLISRIFINKCLMEALCSCTNYFLQYSILLGFNPR